MRSVGAIVLMIVTVIPGIAGVAVFGLAALVDWNTLQIAYQTYEQVATEATSLNAALFNAQANQNLHRINLFADGTWTLLSGILAAIGIHGWVLSRQ